MFVLRNTAADWMYGFFSRHAAVAANGLKPTTLVVLAVLTAAVAALAAWVAGYLVFVATLLANVHKPWPAGVGRPFELQ